ncbi:MAG TPA: SEC-C metal-binding domain-containing protein [Casimicrobiaceae bacterium]|nr:SEC-C metal-binding domain-containing protein [Casimicrobiaceae bacterium]
MNVAPASRNAPCPCGSGLRYKACHGATVGGDAVDPLAPAQERLARGDIDGAAAACRQLLEASPHQPAVLRFAARCATLGGRTQEALSLLLAAARQLSNASVSPAAAYGIWSELMNAFVAALDRVGDADARPRREAYRQWRATRRAGVRGKPIAIVVLLAESAALAGLSETLRSIAQQTRRASEVVIVSASTVIHSDALRRATDVDGLPVPLIVEQTFGSRGEALNAGVAATRSHWLVAIEAPSTLAPWHLGRLFDVIESGGFAWGFTGAVVEADADVDPHRVAAHRATLDQIHSSLARVDSIGQVFIDSQFAAIGVGALGFSRALFTAIGGFRAIDGYEAWDFCLRASFDEEPVHVASTTYVHRLIAGQHQRPATEDAQAQLAMFRSFYARSLADDAAAANPHAPTLANWDRSLLKRVFRSGHVLMVDLPRLEELAGRIHAGDAAPARDLTRGINLIGFAFGEFGLGENLRALARTCEAARVPFVVNDIEHRIGTRQSDRRLAEHLEASVVHNLSLMAVNPDMLDAALPLLRRARDVGGRIAGYWYWELANFPAEWVRALEVVDELWCATGFIAETFARATDKPVIRIPPMLSVKLDRVHRRDEYRLPEHAFLFLFSFDYNSSIARKNPASVIRAFHAAFPRDRDDVGLVVKSINGVLRPDRVAAIDALIDGDPRIHHLDAFLDRERTYGLMSVVDAYVSLHRSEGLGLGLAESMLLGKPVIGTGYSGNLEFMNEANSLLVDYRLVPVLPGEYTFAEPGSVWADANIDAAARAMRRLADDAGLRERLAEGGPGAIRRVFGEERCTTLLRARLQELDLA